LQCGHGQKTVENCGGCARRPPGQKASMRPRPEDRGELRRPVPLHCPPQQASMRPRPEDRGEHPCPVAFGADQGELQCGHGQKTVENKYYCYEFEPDQSFNAATARRPWRTSVGPNNSARMVRHASMRPRPEDRGERPWLLAVNPGGPLLQC